jgi:hypothetical protein
MRSPKNCPLSSGSLLVASYAFPSLHAEGKGECKVMPEIKKRIEKEDRDCLAHRKVEVVEEEEEHHDWVEDDCNVREKLMKKFPGIGVCTSEKPLHRCTPSCHAEDKVEKEVTFKCFDTTRPTKFTMKKLRVEVPTNCVRGSA